MVVYGCFRSLWGHVTHVSAGIHDKFAATRKIDIGVHGDARPWITRAAAKSLALMLG